MASKQGTGYTRMDGADSPEKELSYPVTPTPPAPNAAPAAVSSAPSAPPSGETGGYNYANMGDHKEAENAPDIPPPAYKDVTLEPQEQTFTNVSFLTSDEAKEAVVESAQQNCCYGTKAANEMSVSGLVSASALHYGLESFTETRKTTQKDEPYVGQPIDGPMFGASPPPWSIPVQPMAMFKDEKRELEVPHSATVVQCLTCNGRGDRHCHSCDGRGINHCGMCNQSGTVDGFEGKRETCPSCNGRGHSHCNFCDGSGHVKCMICRGQGRMKRYILLTVRFKNEKDEYVHQSENLGFPDKLVKTGAGQNLFDQSYPRVQALYNHPIPQLNSVSQEMVQQHLSKYASRRIVMQRHWLRGVPITKCQGLWKEKVFDIWVYGIDHKVYMPKYPQRCCGCCSII